MVFWHYWPLMSVGDLSRPESGVAAGEGKDDTPYLSALYIDGPDGLTIEEVPEQPTEPAVSETDASLPEAKAENESSAEGVAVVEAAPEAEAEAAAPETTAGDPSDETAETVTAEASTVADDAPSAEADGVATDAETVASDAPSPEPETSAADGEPFIDDLLKVKPIPAPDAPGRNRKKVAALAVLGILALGGTAAALLSLGYQQNARSRDAVQTRAVVPPEVTQQSGLLQTEGAGAQVPAFQGCTNGQPLSTTALLFVAKEFVSPLEPTVCLPGQPAKKKPTPSAEAVRPLEPAPTQPSTAVVSAASNSGNTAPTEPSGGTTPPLPGEGSGGGEIPGPGTGDGDTTKPGNGHGWGKGGSKGGGPPPAPTPSPSP